jgi:general secretion pathway protein K
MLINKMRDKGSALISALFIMTLVAIAATAMSTRLQLDIYRTRIGIAGDKLYLASQIVPLWALSELANPKQKFTLSDAAGKVLDFPPKLRAIYPETIISGGLYDLQSRFNLNNISDKKFLVPFQELLKNAAKNLNPAQRNDLTTALLNWISPYRPGFNDTNLSYYLKQKPPYYPGYQFMKNSSELRLLPGVSSKIYRSLENYVVALPEVTPVNINSASKTVLMSLGFGLDNTQVGELLSARGKKGITDTSKLNVLLQKLNIRHDQITIESQYFLSVAAVRSGDLSLTLYSILKRSKDKNGKLSLSLLSESMNAIQ